MSSAVRAVRMVVGAAALVAVCVARAEAADVPEPVGVPATVPAAAREPLEALRSELSARRAALVQDIDRHDATCRDVARDDASRVEASRSAPSRPASWSPRRRRRP